MLDAPSVGSRELLRLRFMRAEPQAVIGNKGTHHESIVKSAIGSGNIRDVVRPPSDDARHRP